MKKFIIYSHLYLAMAAVILALEVSIRHALPVIYLIPYYIFLFFAVLIAYSIKFIGLNNRSLADEKRKWVYSNKHIVQRLFVVATGITLGIFFFLPVHVMFLLIPLGIITIAYSIPFRFGTMNWQLRKIPYLKSLLVAIVWTCSVAYLPFKIVEVPINWLLLIDVFLFIFSLAMLFDLKDLENDQNMGLKTIPMALGFEGTKIVSILLLGFRFLFLVFISGEKNFFAELFLFFVVASVLFFWLNRRRSVVFYMVVIDGLVIFKSLIMILLYLF